jgi:hypothetical protein
VAEFENVGKEAVMAHFGTDSLRLTNQKKAKKFFGQ